MGHRAVIFSSMRLAFSARQQLHTPAPGRAWHRTREVCVLPGSSLQRDCVFPLLIHLSPPADKYVIPTQSAPSPRVKVREKELVHAVIDRVSLQQDVWNLDQGFVSLSVHGISAKSRIPLACIKGYKLTLLKTAGAKAETTILLHSRITCPVPKTALGGPV